MTDVPPAWRLAEIVVDAEKSELLADGLWALGVVAVEEAVADDGRTLLRTSVDESATDRLQALAEGHGARLQWLSVPVEVADTWRQHAVPTHVSDDLWLVPAWLEPPPGRAVLVEPFDTFGLGNHPHDRARTARGDRDSSRRFARPRHGERFGCSRGGPRKDCGRRVRVP